MSKLAQTFNKPYPRIAYLTSTNLLIIFDFPPGLHPDIQQTLQEELESVIPKGEDITMDEIKQLVYLEAVIKESLRLYPPVPLISRKISHDLKLGEYVVPKGASLYLNIGALHKDPNVFPEALHFKPERFLAQNQIKSHTSFSFTPFSAGQRNCIGQKFAMNELKIIVGKVLLNFNIESVEDRSDVKVLNAIVCKPLNGIEVRITPKYS